MSKRKALEHYAKQARQATGQVTVSNMTDITERCDRCGAAGQARFLLMSGGDLVFCLHHARQHEAKLAEISLVREQSELFEKATA